MNQGAAMVSLKLSSLYKVRGLPGTEVTCQIVHSVASNEASR